QAVPQQLQQIQYLQQQQLQILQQLLQFVPAQLQQLQQLIQFVPHQIQQSQPSQQWQPFGPPLSGPLGFSLSPQAYLGQPASHVMWEGYMMETIFGSPSPVWTAMAMPGAPGVSALAYQPVAFGSRPMGPSMLGAPGAIGAPAAPTAPLVGSEASGFVT